MACHGTMEQALKLSWFFLHSTVVPNNDQHHHQQTPAFIPRHQATSMAEHSKVAASKVAPKVAPPPLGAVFGGHSHAGHAASSRPAFLSPPATYHHSSQDASPDARDEIGGRPSSGYSMYSPPATFAGIAAEFIPPSTALLRTKPSHDSTDSASDDNANVPMPDLPSVPPASSVHHVSFAPPMTYQTHEYDPRIEYHYETYAYPPKPPTSASYRQHTETYENDGYSSRAYNSNEDITVPNEEVTDRDVKFGRGGGTNRHPGNLYFRKLVEDAKPAYMLSKKTMKGEISRSIVSAVRSQGGRWLKLNNRSGLWEDVGNEEAAKKVSQALREGLALKRREALVASVKTSGGRNKKSIAYPQHLPITKAKCKAK